MKMLPGNGALLPLKSALSTGVKKWLPALFPPSSRLLLVPFKTKTVFSGNSGAIVWALFPFASRPRCVCFYRIC